MTKKEQHKKRLQKCQETHPLPVIETDAKLLEGQGGTLRKFGMSRNTFRDLALKGELPGIKKASW